MLILTLRTDKPESEIGLYEDNQKLVYEIWPAHRQLAETLHIKLKDILTQQGKSWEDVQGLVVYEGPGSFTGLRIGLSVANALADSLQIPIVGATGENWLAEGQHRLANGENQKQVLPEYGAEVHITAPKK